MLRNPRVWLVAAGGWLLVAALVHSSMHVWVFVLENELYGLREFAMNAMKQAESPDPLRPSLWRHLRMLSMGYGLLLWFTGVGNLLLWWTEVRTDAVRTFTLLETVFWAFAFGLFAFLDPVLQPLVVSGVAVPLHAIAFLTADAAP